ncbi:squalene synthase-like [Lineus longissimus]|uniref:squalene synthase-like n=1 Tax=Lineus longissimus TaxID=88925 RepID=UPI002B4D4CE2
MDLLKSAGKPHEIAALLRFKIVGSAVVPKVDYASLTDSGRACYEFLNKTSRSFAAVIQALDGDLRDAVCIFYLVLRALDTVEDDMTIPLDVKVPMLKSFYKNLQDPVWKFMDSKEKDKIVLEQFPQITAEFQKLKPLYQEVISDITQRMGEGMCKYMQADVDTLEDWDEYCHYVAGLVGIGLSRLFSASNFEDPIVGEDTELSNSMGLFLQKINIIRDYLEDSLEGRIFWPKQVWSKYALKFEDLAKPEKRGDALACLNELISSALRHVPDVIKYMARLRNPSVFNFCAIPQVMAIGTYERCYNNPNVFEGIVKIRKGEAVRLMMESTSLDGVKAIMSYFLTQMASRIPSTDPSADIMRSRTNQYLQICRTEQVFATSSKYLPVYVSMVMLTAAIAWQNWTQLCGLYN